MQIIDGAGGKVQNLAQFRVAGLFDGHLNIAGTVRPVPPAEACFQFTIINPQNYKFITTNSQIFFNSFFNSQIFQGLI